MISKNSILLLGESDVGKTHYGAQLLKRLIKGDGRLRMDGAASNLDPYESALESLNEGIAAGHTATATYVDSIWPIVDRDGKKGELIWPDYGGEQIKDVISSRRISGGWRDRILSSNAWLLLIRLQQTRLGDDIFSRPLSTFHSASVENHEVHISDQARFIELLQFLMFVRGVGSSDMMLQLPRLCILLSCWDELEFAGTPIEALTERLPMLSEFVAAQWQSPQVLGLSALGRALSHHNKDMEYITQGPEHFGYVVMPDGSKSADLTMPLALTLESLTSSG